MGLFERFRKREEPAGGIISADILLRKAESNPTVVGHELDVFEAEVQRITDQASIGGGMTPDDWSLISQAAKRSADQLSGYGIAVAPEAFMGLLDED